MAAGVGIAGSKALAVCPVKRDVLRCWLVCTSLECALVSIVFLTFEQPQALIALGLRPGTLSPRRLLARGVAGA